MEKQRFTPGLYSKMVERGIEIAKASNVTDKRGLNKAIDKAIREFGFTPTYVASQMRMHGEYEG